MGPAAPSLTLPREAVEGTNNDKSPPPFLAAGTPLSLTQAALRLYVPPAFTTKATTVYSDITYEAGDILLFGPEPTGLDDEVLAHPRITDLVRIPMLAGRRSLNITSSASIAIYEAWRQLGFVGGS